MGVSVLEYGLNNSVRIINKMILMMFNQRKLITALIKHSFIGQLTISIADLLRLLSKQRCPMLP